MLENLKKYKLIDFLFFSYIFFISYIRVGINVFYYSFTISDVILGIICIIYLWKYFSKKVRYDKTSKQFIILYIIFFITLIISLIGAKKIKFGLIELIPYLYSGILVKAILLYINDRKEIGFNIIAYGFVYSLFFISVTGLIAFASPFLHNLLYIASAEKFIFFTRLPNQLSIFLSVAFLSYLFKSTGWKNTSIFKIAFEILLSLVYFYAQLCTQSRSGLVLAILLVGYFYLKKINFSYIKKNPLKSLLYFIITMCLIVIGLWFWNKKTGIFLTRPFMAMKEMQLLDNFRLQQIPMAWNTFLKNPINGIGIGNYYHYYPGHTTEIHNSFLVFLAETGIIGFMAFISFFGYIIFSIIKEKLYFKMDYYVLLLSIIILTFYHHIFRERWVWAFFTYFVSTFIIHKSKKGLQKK